MLHSPLAHPFQSHNAPCHAIRIADHGRNVLQLLDPAGDQRASRTSPLGCYLEGWAEADLGKILDATVSRYPFRDPFVGIFSRHSLHEYFNLVIATASCRQERPVSDTVFPTRSPLHASPTRTLAGHIGAMGASACTLIREWRHRYRSRRELALYSYDERKDLSFAAEVDSEIPKPFWKK
jgi:uncharacterized protein YjiS (DUF1127 family)